MCGIFAYHGQQQALPLLVEGLRRLEYRGYDSTGVALANGDEVVRFRTVGKVGNLHSVLPSEHTATKGIAHTRWATHGGVTEANTHPHASFDGEVHLVHNGIIENFRQLKAQLSASGITCTSETDSEVLAHHVALGLKEGRSPEEAVAAVLNKARGTWGLCVMFTAHDATLTRSLPTPTA